MWLVEHYDTAEDSAGHHLVCKRCRQRVGWVTRHAAERHGDAIEVMAPVEGKEQLVDVY